MSERQVGGAMVPDLIFDVGMHDGSDTSFYLQKGYRVVAIDANPLLCARARAKHRRDISNGRLTVINEGVAAQRQELTFYVNNDKDDWSSFDPNFAHRSSNLTEVKVFCRPFAEYLDQFGVPYYLKIDIEGHDEYCVQGLENSSELPRYVSTEATVQNFGDRMATIGYDRFKMISQYWIQSLRCPKPAREGLEVDMTFSDFSSGPFGEETYGPWLTLAEFKDEYHKCAHRIFEGSLHERLGCEREMFMNSWFDFHARLG
jgi:FkbM family methyltransferase